MGERGGMRAWKDKLNGKSIYFRKVKTINYGKSNPKKSIHGYLLEEYFLWSTFSEEVIFEIYLKR